MSKQVKIVDLFAGPGGLGEGFASMGPKNNPTFKIVVSVEKEVSAHKTLMLRAFTRQLNSKVLPLEYYQYIRGQISKQTLIDLYPSEWAAASKETLGGPVSLGEDNQIIHSAISDALGENKDPWVLIGGPPCQAYSLVGRARNLGIKGYVPEKDIRHTLYKEYLDIIIKFRPAVFVMENVRGILSSTLAGQSVFEGILADLKGTCEGKSKYEILSLSNPPRSSDLLDGAVFEPKDFVIKSEEYGIPQARHRVVLLGIRKDLNFDMPGVVLDKSTAVNVGRVLSNMPKLRSGLSKQPDTAANWHTVAKAALVAGSKYLNVSSDFCQLKNLPVNRGTKFVRSNITLSKHLPASLRKWLEDVNLQGIIQHESRGHMASDIDRYAYISLFGKLNKRSPLLSDLPKELLPAHKNVTSGKFVDRFKVQLRDLPSKTITSHIAKDSHAFIHFDPMQARGFTVREAARLQTFPENYFFEGNRTQQYVQVGNAVPPYLAYKISKKVKCILHL